MEKKVTVILCDLCRTDRPGEVRVTINRGSGKPTVFDLCAKHATRLDTLFTVPNKVKEEKGSVLCELCGRNFGSNTALGAHRFRAHGIRSQKATETITVQATVEAPQEVSSVVLQPSGAEG